VPKQDNQNWPKSHILREENLLGIDFLWFFAIIAQRLPVMTRRA